MAAIIASLSSSARGRARRRSRAAPGRRPALRSPSRVSAARSAVGLRAAFETAVFSPCCKYTQHGDSMLQPQAFDAVGVALVVQVKAIAVDARSQPSVRVGAVSIAAPPLCFPFFAKHSYGLAGSLRNLRLSLGRTNTRSARA